MKLTQTLSAIMCSIILISGVSCSKINDFEKQLDELDSRVTAMESQIKDLNSNVASLKYLTEGAVITDVKETTTGYELTLSDGSTVTINHGTDGENGTTPTVSIDEDGYWVINGEKQSVKAHGTDGVTPKFSVDAEDYWIISYDNGATWVRVKDAAGNDVKAKVTLEGNSNVVAQDTFFADVELKDDVLVLTLKDNTVVNVPVIKGFSFMIKKDGAPVQGLQEIEEGTAVTYDVEQTGVASAAIIACPAGFDVELTDNSLTVTALPATKASASLSKDLAILAVSDKGVSAVVKIQIEKVAPKLEATLLNETHECYSFNSVTLSATFKNTNRIHCLIKAATEEPATADDLKAQTAVEANEGVATLSKSDLIPSTDYVAYYLASDGTNFGEDVQTFEFTTRAVSENNLYEKFMTEGKITVAGMEITKETYPTPTYICRGTSSRGLLKTGLAFVESHADVIAGCNSGLNNLIVVGTDPAKRSNVSRTGKANLDPTSETGDFVIFANICYNFSGTSDHIFQLNNVENLEKISLENCYFEIQDSKALLAYVNNDRKITDLNIEGCDCKITNKGFLIQSRNTPIKSIKINNNVFFAAADSNHLFYVLDYTGSNLTDVETISLTNNTFYNTKAPSGSQGYIRAKSITTSLTLTGNLFYDCQGSNYNAYIYYNKITGDVHQFPVAEVIASQNIASIPKDSSNKVYIIGSSSIDGLESIALTDFDFPLTDWNPAAGSFKIDGTYSDKGYFGATR